MKIVSHIFIPIIIIVFFFSLVFVHYSYAQQQKSGVTWMIQQWNQTHPPYQPDSQQLDPNAPAVVDPQTNIENDYPATIIGPGDVHYDMGPDYVPSTPTIEGSSYFDSGDGSANSVIGIGVSLDNMRREISNTIGVPEANTLVVILFSFAALIQLVRMLGGGGGDWMSFIVRTVTILAFLKGFSVLFNGVESFFSYVGSCILGGKSAYEVFWNTWSTAVNSLSLGPDNYDPSLWALITDVFSHNNILYFTVWFSNILAFAFYLLIYLVQACIIIALQYLGPLIICLALIPEINFTKGYIVGAFQVFLWTIVGAILIKIISTVPQINNAGTLNTLDFIALVAMNICFAMSFLFIPKISEMVMNGHGWHSMANAITNLASSSMKGGARAASSYGSRLIGAGTRAAGSVVWSDTKGAAGWARQQGRDAVQSMRMRKVPVSDSYHTASNYAFTGWPKGNDTFLIGAQGMKMKRGSFHMISAGPQPSTMTKKPEYREL